MSTRCQIGIYKNEALQLKNWDVLLYKHSDGYVEGTLSLLCDFVYYFNKKRGLTDTEYAGARLIQFLTNQNIFNNILGYGISKDFHGDIEYFYKISPTKIEVFKTHFKPNYKEWELIQTEDLTTFPYQTLNTQ